MSSYSCPKGHDSADADFCSVCGAKMAPDESSLRPIANQTVCPDCGTKRDVSGAIFCELCGYNFTTGSHGDLRPLGATAPATTPAQTDPDSAPAPATVWQVTITIDPSLRTAESPEAPAGVQPLIVPLIKESSLIGRLSERRGVFPDIALDADDAVSHRHALLNIGTDGGLVLRDIGSSNGTRLNGAELQAMTDIVVKDGDQITLGHWTRLEVKPIP